MNKGRLKKILIVYICCLGTIAFGQGEKIDIKVLEKASKEYDTAYFNSLRSKEVTIMDGKKNTLECKTRE